MTLKTDMDNVVNGKNDATNFGAQMIRIVLKADGINKNKLRTLYPNLVETVMRWQNTDDAEILDLPYD